MYRLRLFGGATLEGPEGPLSGRIAQRRQLAVLAFLSLQGDRPTPRDKLLALLWPRSNTERARHNLADTVYLVRKALGEDSVRSMGDDLALSPDHIRSDVAAFETLLERGELKEAADLYAGPFLDAFHLSDSLEFEHWLEAERERLQRAYLGALEELATAAGAAGNHAGAVEWWRKAAVVQPHNSRLAAGLMRSLAAAGDRPGALRWAAVHEELLREEFGIDPDPSVTALARQFREGAEEVAPTVAGPDAPGDVGDPGEVGPHHRPDASGHAATEEEPPEPAGKGGKGPGPGLEPPPTRPRPERPHRGVLFGFALGLGVLFLAAALYLRHNGDEPSTAHLAHGLDEDAVVVVPFRTAGASPEVEYLGQGMVELLAAKLGGDGGLRAVDPAAALAGWRTAAADGDEDPTSERAIELARAQGAGNAITGAVVGTPSALTLHGSMADAATGEIVARGTVEGTEHEIHELVDRLVAQLLVRRAGEEEHRLAHLTTTSPPALRAFLHGRAAHRQGRYEEALRHYAGALELDSTFALAGRGVLQLAGWVGGTAPLQAQANAVVSAQLDRLSERDRVGLRGRLAPRSPGQVPSAVERIAEAEDALRRWPDHPVLWYRRGDELLHFGRPLALPSWERRARESFQRAMALDPDYAEPVHHLAVLLAETGDTAALRTLVTEQLARTPTGPVADHLRWRAHHSLGDASPVRPPPLEEMDTDATLRWIGIEAQDYGFAIEEGAQAIALRLDRPGIRDEHLERRQGAFAWALNRGRPAEALSVLETMRDVQPAPRSHLRIVLLTALYADGDEAAATRAAAELAEAVVVPPPAVGTWEDAVAHLDLCILAQWRFAREVEDGAAASEVPVPPLAPPTDQGPLSSLRVICSAVVHAQRAALVTGQADGPETEHLESLLAMGRHFGLVDGGHTEFAHVALARLLEAAGHPDAALRAVRRRSLYLGWQPYLATMLREEGRLAAELGDAPGALRAWEHYLAFRTDPEPPLRDEVERIRREVEGLRPGGSDPRSSSERRHQGGHVELERHRSLRMGPAERGFLPDRRVRVRPPIPHPDGTL